MSNKITAALSLAGLGFAVFPLHALAKAPPLVKDWPNQATTSKTDIGIWWIKWPEANIGIHCEGLLVVDVDVKKDGDASLAALEDISPLPPTLTTKTPTGGRHLFYRLPKGHPGVQNGVDVLGKGLDIRSMHGYVVAPGSEVEAGRYVFAGADEIAAAPDWLVQECGRFTEREHKPDVNIPDADESIVTRASEWLESAPRSVQGAGGDETAYKVACGLRDFGLSYLQTCELMRSLAWDEGCGWRAGWLEQKPIASAYRYATSKPGSKVALASDFEVSDEPVEAKPGRVVSFSDVVNVQRNQRPYLIKNVLYRGTITQMYGVPGRGKTFLALDMGFHIACGRPWHGYPVKQAPVLYIAFEGIGGLWKRFAALQKQYHTDNAPLFLMDGSGIDLRQAADRKQLGADINAMEHKPGLIVIDTFHQALAGGDENSSQDVGHYLTAIGGLISHGIGVMHLHHPGKDSSRGGRGSSAMFGALDTEFEIADFQVNIKKQRDVELVDAIPFKLKQVEIGLDDDGDPITSCVVMESAGVPAVLPAVKGNTALVWRSICRQAPKGEPLARVDLLESCKTFLPQSRARASFAEALDQLEARRMITFDSNVVKRTVGGADEDA